MEQFIRFLDLLKDAPAWVVAAGAVALVVLPVWWLLRKLFRPAVPKPVRPPAMPPKPVLKEPSADEPSDETPKPFSLPPPIATDDDSPAIAGFRRALADRGVAAGEVNALLREYAAQLNDMRLRLAEIAEARQSSEDELSDVLAALDAGRFDDALAALDKIGRETSEKGRATRQLAERQLTAATLARLVAGDLALAARDPETAERHYRLAIEALPAGAEALLAECLNKHGTAAYRADKLEVAAMSFRRAVKLLERLKGHQDPDVATALNNLAMLYYARGDLNAAEPLYRRALDIDETVTGENSTAVATDLNNLALLLKKQNRIAEAEPLLKRALEIKEQRLEAGHPSLLTGIKNYAAVLRLMKRDTEAEALDKRAEAIASGEAPRRAEQGQAAEADTPAAKADADETGDQARATG